MKPVVRYQSQLLFRKSYKPIRMPRLSFMGIRKDRPAAQRHSVKVCPQLADGSREATEVARQRAEMKVSARIFILKFEPAHSKSGSSLDWSCIRPVQSRFESAIGS